MAEFLLCVANHADFNIGLMLACYFINTYNCVCVYRKILHLYTVFTLVMFYVVHYDLQFGFENLSIILIEIIKANILNINKKLITTAICEI